MGYIGYISIVVQPDGKHRGLATISQPINIVENDYEDLKKEASRIVSGSEYTYYNEMLYDNIGNVIAVNTKKEG